MFTDNVLQMPDVRSVAVIDMRIHQNGVLWNGINPDSKEHADIKAQMNIHIFGL